MLPNHEHQAATLCFVIDGLFEEKFDNRVLVGSTGVLIYRPANYAHSDRFLGNRTVTFSLDLSPEEAEYGPSRPSVVSSRKTSKLLSHLYRLSLQPDQFAGLAVDSVLLAIQDELALVRDESQLRPPGWLRRIHKLLDAGDAGIPTLDELAAAANVHPMHLTRAFRKFYGCSVGEYQREVRIDRCCSLLKTTSLSIGEIAMVTGFCDQAHFTRAFRSKQGCTPRQYRESRMLGLFNI